MVALPSATRGEKEEIMRITSLSAYKYPTKPRVPRLVELPNQKVAFIQLVGDPNVVCGSNLPALYTTVYGIKKTLKVKGRAFQVDKLRARWPDAENAPKGQWTGLYALPIPNDTAALPSQSKVPELEVQMATWEYGLIAEILHIGPYTEEGPTFDLLHRFVKERGYKVFGPHEEVYLSDPRRVTPDKMKTILRCRLQER